MRSARPSDATRHVGWAPLPEVVPAWWRPLRAASGSQRTPRGRERGPAIARLPSGSPRPCTTAAWRRGLDRHRHRHRGRRHPRPARAPLRDQPPTTCPCAMNYASPVPQHGHAARYGVLHARNVDWRPSDVLVSPLGTVPLPQGASARQDAACRHGSDCRICASAACQSARAMA